MVTGWTRPTVLHLSRLCNLYQSVEHAYQAKKAEFHNDGDALREPRRSKDSRKVIVNGAENRCPFEALKYLNRGFYTAYCHANLFLIFCVRLLFHNGHNIVFFFACKESNSINAHLLRPLTSSLTPEPTTQYLEGDGKGEMRFISSKK